MEFLDALAVLLSGAVRAGTPLAFAALGQLICEKSGVLNLGVEGMMLMGAVMGVVGTVTTGNIYAGIAIAAFAGLLMSLMFGVLALSLRANQVATGLALTIFGVGLSAFIGISYTGIPINGLKPLELGFFQSIPVLGLILFSYDVMVYGSIVLFIAVWWFLKHTRSGLILRSVGENHEVAYAIGFRVIFIRYCAVMFGGACCGLAGAYLSLAYTPQWSENMTAGRGWIALALVVFATWRPANVLAGAYLFGGITIAGLHLQGLGFELSSHLVATFPYLATIIVLVIISRDAVKIRLNAPASLGKVFQPRN